MRLIDANEIENLFNAQVERGATDLFDAFEDALQDAQAVDAVVVTRCKDCKHRGWVQEPCHGKSVDYCKIWGCILQNLESTFCSYGERRDKP